MKKSLVVLLSFIAFLTFAFIILGLMFDKDDNEKQAGLTDVYDVSANGDIAYITYEKGVANLFVSNEEKPLVQLPVEDAITDTVFSSDGKMLAYTVAEKELETSEETEVHIYDLEKEEDEMIFSSDSLITELVFDPKTPDVLFYLQAGIVTNYSPVASERPHEFDVYSYHLTEKKQTKHTDMKKYSMMSLQVSAEKNSVFVQMDDDEHAETADDIFSSSQRIFEIPLNNPVEKSIISSPVQADDIYDFVIIPESQEIVYQAVGGTDENGTYEYELFTFNWRTYKTEQLTALKESSSNPKLGADDKIYFMVDRGFGQRTSDYHLYRIDRDGKSPTEVKLNAID